MNRKHIVLVLVLILGVTLALGCTESSEDSDAAVESETLQTGEAQAMQEETPASANTEETEAETLDIVTRKEAEIEEETEETVTPTISSENMVWISVMTDDIADVQSDMDGFSNAATNNDMRSLSIYCDRLYTSTNTAIDHCDTYDVSAELQPVEDEYRLAMVAFNWVAVYCYAGIESYNAGNAADATTSFNTATEFVYSGSEHLTKATDLLNEYNENHGI